MGKADCMSLGELMEKCEEDKKKLYSSEGLDGVSCDGVAITLGGWYYIDLDRMATKESLLHWLAHLVTKNWVTRKHLYLVIKIASEHHGYNPYTQGE